MLCSDGRQYSDLMRSRTQWWMRSALDAHRNFDRHSVIVITTALPMTPIAVIAFKMAASVSFEMR